jgi:uncharacterized membrane protein
VAFKGLGFYVGTIEHFAFGFNEEHYGRFWPNRFWLVLHIVGGSAALFAGPFQIWTGLRETHLHIHRWTGRVYVTGVLVGGAAAFYLSAFSRPRSFGIALFVLAVAWWITMGRAIAAIRQHRIEAHKAWMIRSYVVTLSFVSFRILIELPLWAFAGQSALPLVLWLSWGVPLALTEVVLRRLSSPPRALRAPV